MRGDDRIQAMLAALALIEAIITDPDAAEKIDAHVAKVKEWVRQANERPREHPWLRT